MDLEQISYDLRYYGDDDEVTRQLIVETIARLPEEVTAFALERCAFVSVGRTAYGMVLPGSVGVHPQEKRTRNMWFILLAEDLPAGDAHSIIAHEIAHAWLGHDRTSPDTGLDCEPEAAQQVQQWGFAGMGADEEAVDLRKFL